MYINHVSDVNFSWCTHVSERYFSDVVYEVCWEFYQAIQSNIEVDLLRVRACIYVEALLDTINRIFENDWMSHVESFWQEQQNKSQDSLHLNQKATFPEEGKSELGEIPQIIGLFVFFCIFFLFFLFQILLFRERNWFARPRITLILSVFSCTIILFNFFFLLAAAIRVIFILNQISFLFFVDKFFLHIPSFFGGLDTTHLLLT